MQSFNSKILQSFIEMLATLDFTLDIFFLRSDLIDFILDFEQSTSRSASLASYESFFKFLLFFNQICILFLEVLEMSISLIKKTIFTEIFLISF